MARVLVTGGAGFIGSHLCERLVARGDQVVVFDDLSSGNLENLASVHDRVTLITAPLSNLLRYQEAIGQVSLVFHLAALISGYDSLAQPDAYLDTNVCGLLRVVDLIKDTRGARVVFASSVTVYGNSAHAVRTERTPPEPTTMYALSKLAGEHTLEMYRQLHGIDYVCLRLTNVYGPRQSPSHAYANVSCKYAYAAATGARVKLYGDGQQTRDFVFVEDAVDALMLASCGSPSRLYNVGTGVQTSVASLLEETQFVAGHRLEIERLGAWPNDIRVGTADISKIRTELGFAPRVSIREGLGRTIDFFRSRP